MKLFVALAAVIVPFSLQAAQAVNVVEKEDISLLLKKYSVLSENVALDAHRFDERSTIKSILVKGSTIDKKDFFEGKTSYVCKLDFFVKLENGSEVTATDESEGACKNLRTVASW